jgi:hypothetical protein
MASLLADEGPLRASVEVSLPRRALSCSSAMLRHVHAAPPHPAFAPRVGRTKTPEDCGFRVFQIRYAELGFGSVLLALCSIRSGFPHDCRTPLRWIMRLMGYCLCCYAAPIRLPPGRFYAHLRAQHRVYHSAMRSTSASPRLRQSRASTFPAAMSFWSFYKVPYVILKGTLRYIKLASQQCNRPEQHAYGHWKSASHMPTYTGELVGTG